MYCTKENILCELSTPRYHNGNDSSQLEDWLIDIKTTSDLTNKSRTKLAQAKSKG